MTTAKTASAQTARAEAVADAAPLVELPPPWVVLLRAQFPAAQVGKLPRITCKACSDKNCSDHQKAKCAECGNFITTRHIHLDYVGHGAVTSRLLEVDPRWSWEPVAWDAGGLPMMERDNKGNPVSLWMRLTVCGTTRLGVGTCPSGQFEAEKVLIGDALRNAAMRFGVALDLWVKGHSEDDEQRSATEDRRGPVRQVAAATGAVSGADLVKAGLATLEPDLQEKLRADVVTRSGLASFDEAMTREDWRKWLTEAIVFYRDKAAPTDGHQTARDGETGVGALDGAGGAPAANGGGLVAGQGYTAEALTQARADVSEMPLIDVEELLAGWDGGVVSGDEAQDRAALAVLFAARASASG